MGYIEKHHHVHQGRRAHSDLPTRAPQQEPAYEGAKFDVSGHCLKHPEIRMCRPTTNKSSKEIGKSSNNSEMKYVIVRKTCHLCGEHALRNERKLNKKSWAHGYDVIKLQPRKSSPKGMMIKAKLEEKTSSAPSSRRGGIKNALPSSTSNRRNKKIRTPDTPPASPESNRSTSKELTVKLVDSSSPPPQLQGRGRLPGGRVRLHGVIPAGLPLDSRFFAPPQVVTGKVLSKKSTSGSSTDCSSDDSGSSRTERHCNMVQTSKSKDLRNEEIIIKRLDHLQVS